MHSTVLWSMAFASSAVVGCADVVVYEDIPYDARFGASTTMDIYTPEGTGPHPTVMLIHGGSWSGFSKDAFDRHAERLADAGYVAATINYRLLPEGTYPALFQDVFCALAFLRANAQDYSIDPDRIASYGYSAGGHLASIVGLAADVEDFAPDCEWGPTDGVDVVVSGAGIENFSGMDHVEVVRELLGGTEDDFPERYRLASPISHVRPEMPPFLLIRGMGDVSGGIERAEEMRDAIDAVGGTVELLGIAGGGHLLNSGPQPGFLEISTSMDTPEAWAVTIDFLDRNL